MTKRASKNGSELAFCSDTHNKHTALRRVADSTGTGSSVPVNSYLPEPPNVAIGSLHFSPKQVTQTI